MDSDAWAQYCRAALVRSVAAAAAQFPGPGEEAPKRVHDVRKTLKEARAIARLFLHCVGEPARVTIAALAATRRQIGRTRDLDVMAIRVQRLEPPPEVLEPLMAAIAREREAAQRARRGLSANAPRARLNAIVRRVEGWDLSAVGTEEIVAAVARTYRQARRRGRLAFAIDDPGALHAVRARVVDLRYQLALLSCAWPEALDAQAEGLDELREALGDHHDLMCWGRSQRNTASCRRRRWKTSAPAWRRSRKSSGGAPMSSSSGSSLKRRTRLRLASRPISATR